MPLGRGAFFYFMHFLFFYFLLTFLKSQWIESAMQGIGRDQDRAGFPDASSPGNERREGWAQPALLIPSTCPELGNCFKTLLEMGMLSM